MVDINLLKNQAKYIDEKIRCLEIHLEYPASLIYPKQENIIMAEEVITNISTKNKELMKDISEEERAARHNLEETNSFLQSVKAESERMASEVQDMSKQLEDYGYVPLPKQNETQDDTFIIVKNGGTQNGILYNLSPEREIN